MLPPPMKWIENIIYNVKWQKLSVIFNSFNARSLNGSVDAGVLLDADGTTVWTGAC